MHVKTSLRYFKKLDWSHCLIPRSSRVCKRISNLIGLINFFFCVCFQGMEIALATVLPNEEHRNCAKNVYANWKKTYVNEDNRPFFWRVAYNRTISEFESMMDELCVFDRELHDDLKTSDPSTWCRAFFSTVAQSDNVCNNLYESLNMTIKKFRELPLIHMLETIRRQAMMCVS